MEQEDKKLLLKDLCARVPYGVKIEGYELPCIVLDSDWLHFMYTHQEFAIRRPYLRPMSSMTADEVGVYINLKENIIGSDGLTYFFETYESIDWLKDKVQPQLRQEWSEEDEYHKRQILRILKDNGCSQTLQERTEKWIEERLKSLRPQTQWKPTDKQMRNLSCAAHHHCAFFDTEILKGLYDDLKKL